PRRIEHGVGVFEVRLGRRAPPDDAGAIGPRQPTLGGGDAVAGVALLKCAFARVELVGARHAGRKQRGRGNERASASPAERHRVLSTVTWSVPDSGSQTSPGRPRIWRTLAPSRSHGKTSN